MFLIYQLHLPSTYRREPEASKWVKMDKAVKEVVKYY